MDTHLLWNILAGVLIVVGLLGTVLPVLPGLPVMFAGMLLAAWNDGFARIGVWTLVILGVLVALSVIADVGAGMLGAKRVGASNKALVGAGLGGLAGLFFGLPGLLLGPFAGAVAGEMVQGRKLGDASKIGFGTWVGMAVGAALKIALAFAMLAVFAIAMWGASVVGWFSS